LEATAGAEIPLGGDLEDEDVIPPANNRLPLPEDVNVDLPALATDPPATSSTTMVHPETQFDLGIKPPNDAVTTTPPADADPDLVTSTITEDPLSSTTPLVDANDIVIDDVPDDGDVVFDTAFGEDGIPPANDDGPIIKFPTAGGGVPLPATVVTTTTATENGEEPTTTEAQETTTDEPEVTTVEVGTTTEEEEVDEITEQPATTEAIVQTTTTTEVPVTEPAATEAPVEETTTVEPTVVTEPETQTTTVVVEVTPPGLF
jgi:hypothetical protein